MGRSTNSSSVARQVNVGAAKAILESSLEKLGFVKKSLEFTLVVVW